MRNPHLLLPVLALGALATACVGDPNTRPGSAGGLDRPEVARSLLDAATMAAAQGDLATAATYYRNVYLRDPGNSRAALGLMRSLREVGDLDQARQVADAVQLAKPNEGPIMAEVGKVRLASGQLQPAIVALTRAAELEPAEWRTLSALGVAQDRLGERTKAEESYRAALALSPDNPLILNNLALSRAMAGDLTGARELLQRAVATSRADLRVRQNLALVYALSGNLAQAEALTLQDLPPDLARETLAYYRELAARSQTPR